MRVETTRKRAVRAYTEESMACRWYSRQSWYPPA